MFSGTSDHADLDDEDLVGIWISDGVLGVFRDERPRRPR